MIQKFFSGAALAAGILFAGQIDLAAAAPMVPALSGTGVQGIAIQEAAWQCGPRRCVWVPGYRGPIPGYARTWGPPTFPNCYWKRGLLGKWKYKCDDD